MNPGGVLSPTLHAELERLAEALASRRVCVLTGAGCSTESGIPDYRGEGTARRARNPIQFKQFVGDEAGRRRYWARALLGWRAFRQARPGRAHHALCALERAGIVTGIITQNVDRLHTRAGSRAVVELHGALEEVICLDCGSLEAREDLQTRLECANPSFLQLASEIAPDGDADLLGAQAAEWLDHFRVESCLRCSGILKPHVVFFGEGVPKERVDAAWDLYAAADALLVVGSSLTVFSGFRFPRRASRDGKPIYLINWGATRADPLSVLKVRGAAGPCLEHLARLLAV